MVAQIQETQDLRCAVQSCTELSNYGWSKFNVNLTIYDVRDTQKHNNWLNNPNLLILLVQGKYSTIFLCIFDCVGVENHTY